MSSKPLADHHAIRFDGVTKSFKKARGQAWAGDLRNDVNELLGRIVGRRSEDSKNRVLALEDVSFSIERGETVALLGANGAGKSTCLRLISNVSRPTAGEIWVRGRVAALIQVGAGFHRELSGRENVYLYGSILGLSRAQLDERFDSIVSFSELSDFLDMPLKHYSSGMAIRLGFSVAIHVDADILLIDEVLSVGDASFRAKSAAYLQGLLKKSKVTAIIVSHDLELLRQHCKRGIYIRDARVAMDGPIDEVVERYLDDVGQHDN